MSLQSKGDSAQPRIQQLTQQVLENTEASLAVYPTYSSTWLFRGLAFSFQKNFSAAVECLGQADHLRPNSGDIRTNLGVACREYGRILYNEKKWEEAANNLSRAFNYLPGDYETAAMAGIAYINLKNFDSAATYFEQYTKGRPDDPNGYVNLSYAYRQSGKTQQADETMKKLQQLKAGK